MKCKYYKPYMDTLSKIVGEYYSLEDCGCGGPLHILLDDDNYDIGSIRWCISKCFEGIDPRNKEEKYYPEYAYILGIVIGNEYAKMSLEERATFNSLLNGSDLECDGNCSDCPYNVLDDICDWMREAEEE